ncbi:MAG: hypothetical protein IKU47_03435 [Oscillospiraceae bacterium]|nr:hypothetical protein [Oscillospiraceae bacterium]
MAEYIDRKELLENLKKFAPEHYSALVNTLITKQPAVDVVSMAVHQQVRWERDTAIGQLEEYGICFGEKKKDLVEVVRCKDCKLWQKSDAKMGNSFDDMQYVGSCEWANYRRFENDFCSYGERKTE